MRSATLPAPTRAAVLGRGALRAAIDGALGTPSSRGGLRAFAVEGMTCVVEWRPSEAGAHIRVTLALRRGALRREHSATLSDVSLLPRTLEHHCRAFLAE